MCGCNRGAGHICGFHMKVLHCFMAAVEKFVVSDRDMPAHRETVMEFTQLFEEAKGILGVER